MFNFFVLCVRFVYASSQVLMQDGIMQDSLHVIIC